jgi:hypothetical protein
MVRHAQKRGIANRNKFHDASLHALEQVIGSLVARGLPKILIIPLMGGSLQAKLGAAQAGVVPHNLLILQATEWTMREKSLKISQILACPSHMPIGQ